MESILDTVKKSIGPSAMYEYFDSDLIMHINSVFFDLTQMGVGPPEGFMIEDNTAIWEDFIPEAGTFEAVKSYMCLRVKQLFDPPAGSAQAEALQRQIDKWEWRLNVEAENMKSNS